ncbi:hypothetical protein PC129_g21094 [Phytophthora cactorum]|uniref:RxLR effector protein n=1 Tax=Phytophthora cactorum TaxID=29920 RepID=A0A329RZ92_9STRA|nr:hypothetical protein Pcac1_g18975 [Phytophthora cactorum]KAG2808756.1 hypothetical protein PC111_g16348 [Phytophthora cactorum]KAG2827494.1 hypothetical protein PC112_g8817 [Phytophthora cactorum]KAG2843984.1 hypothetical protein PC113_g18497 [Phytophthora cactorum]KAG2884353.1 hypothetical protein PC114_g20143 [Phytophthora cactorum]
MRLIYILAVIIAAALRASGTALPVAKDFKAMIENGAALARSMRLLPMAGDFSVGSRRTRSMKKNDLD